MAKTPREQVGVDMPEPEEPQAPPAATQEPVADQRPEWLPEKYEKPEDLARAYAEAERKLQEQGNEISQLREQYGGTLEQLQGQLEELQAARSQMQTADPMEPAYAEIERAYEDGDMRRVAELNAWITQQTVAQAFQGMQAQQPQGPTTDHLMAADYVDRQLAARYEDWGDYKEKVAAEIERNPDLIPPLTSPLEAQQYVGLIYEAVKGRELAAREQTLVEQGLSAEDMERQRKLQAQTLSGASGRAEQPSRVDDVLASMRQARSAGSWGALRSGSS